MTRWHCHAQIYERLRSDCEQAAEVAERCGDADQAADWRRRAEAWEIARNNVQRDEERRIASRRARRHLPGTYRE